MNYNKNSWGNYPIIKKNIFSFKNTNELQTILSTIQTKVIAFGNGRSYGDSALNHNIIDCSNYNKILNFDTIKGIITCQAGVTFEQILDLIVEKGWFFKVTPGTKFITVGGAIASDVHGKNHHIEGCFSKSIIEIKMMLADGTITTCSNDINSDLFKATCGGNGLTGIILEATFSLKKIHSQNIEETLIKTSNLLETFEVFENYKNEAYSVAWIDCFATKNNIGKSIVMTGDFTNDTDLNYQPKTKLTIPFYLPKICLNKYTIKLFNFMYYNKIRDKIKHTIVNLDTFFYPLDAINDWNKIYGKDGFTQYQCILPKEKSYEGMYEILSTIEQSGKGSFLAILKLYGKENENFLSFPLEGYSLALDFKIEPNLFDLLDKLDKIVEKYEGRIYLTKDVRTSKKSFEKGYKQLNKFKEIKKQYDNLSKFESLQSKRLGI